MLRGLAKLLRRLGLLFAALMIAFVVLQRPEPLTAVMGVVLAIVFAMPELVVQYRPGKQDVE